MIRILLLADSHLGFDLPERPRVQRRRRGHDFLDNYARALAPALAGEADLVVHAGDVFDRPRVSASVAYQAYAPLVRIADRGIPVFIVPGNHERSRLPHTHLLVHRNIHVFDRPRTFTAVVRGIRVGLAGFPYQRRNVRGTFAALLDESGWQNDDCDVRLLCLHHCVEGATVGPQNFTFRGADDVIRINDIPHGFAALLSGHIHRHQVLSSDLAGRPVAVPILYPGSIERTALAEIGEAKGYVMMELAAGVPRWEFRRLPARPMIARDVEIGAMTASQLRAAVGAIAAAAPRDAVLWVRCTGAASAGHARMLSSARLRELVPATMNVAVKFPALETTRPRTRRSVREQPDIFAGS